MPKPKPALKLTERDVTRQIRDFLEFHGWRAIRMQSGLMGRPTGGAFRVGELGMPDRLFLRYGAAEYNERLAEVLWIEMKAPGKKASAAQETWAASERLRGATVVAVNDFDEFREWYRREVRR